MNPVFLLLPIRRLCYIHINCMYYTLLQQISAKGARSVGMAGSNNFRFSSIWLLSVVITYVTLYYLCLRGKNE